MKPQPLSPELHRQHLEVTRRYFMQLGATGLAAMNTQGLWAKDSDETILADATEDLEYLTTPNEFRTVERGKPLPYTLPLGKRLELGLERESWKLEVIADPKSNAQMRNPLSLEKGNALNFKGLMKLAEKHAVRFLKVMTCNNMKEPLGMGLWEGVPLRNAIWATKPTANIRRVYFYGHHNEDPKQIFQSSLPIGRVLEDPPGDNPIILCYKLNGQWLSGRRGGPVRMLVSDAYGFKSVKWLKSVVLTNNHQANDTYAKGNNDIDSQMKTMARFIYKPLKEKAGNPIAITGLAHVGISGLSKVQVWINPQEKTWPKEDPYFTKAPWQDAKILPPPTKWGGDLPGGKLPPDVRFFTREGQPKHWPMRYTIAHWATLLKGVAPGKYDVYCRTIDSNHFAQPMPRPFRKSGPNTIQKASITVEI
ncbi:MAG: molybdopterin-dependent oxidoreductase [Verrucomicrobiota bacterium]|nr:molybdopterin-dependent oxidoreductase [Verrucomicrobiota bacterium]